MTFKNQEGFCFSAHYKGLSAGMTMQVWRLEHHLLEMILPWVKKIGVTQLMSTYEWNAMLPLLST